MTRGARPRSMNPPMARPDDSRAAPGAAAPGQQALLERLATLRTAVAQACEQALAAPPEARAALARRALLCQELLIKLQEQVLLPALLEGRPRAAVAVALAGREADLIRDLSALWHGLSQPAPASGEQRGELLAVIDGLAALNAQRVDGLLREAAVAPLRWPALLDEVEAMLARWRDEWRRDGDIDDEDRDPVGAPPG